jgi:hypothetical protein
MNNTFIINDKGELDFKGEVFIVKPEYHILSKESKLDILIMLVNWANEEIEKATIL